MAVLKTISGLTSGKSSTRGRDERSGIVNAAKTLLANIRFLDVDNPVRSIAITSAVPNEGKTFVAANLASAIATSGKTVLLVECDMRRRSMAHTLGTHAKHGIYSVLAGEVQLTSAAIATNVPNLYFLDAEPHIPNPSDILSSERFNRLISYALSVYDYVVFDTPPVGTFVDAAVLGTKLDAVFMVVREGFTKKAEIAAAAEQLRKSGCNLAGVIMNYCERRDSEYYYEYYYSKSGHHDENAPELSARSAAEAAAPKATRQPVPVRPQRATSATSAGTAAHQGQRQPVPQRPQRPERTVVIPEVSNTDDEL